MAKYRDYLPQIDGDFFQTHGGLETTLAIQNSIERPLPAAIELMKTDKGRERLRTYYAPHIEIARDAGAGLILEAPTWRASTDWGRRLGYTDDTLAAANRAAVEMLHGIRLAQEDQLPIVVSGCIGPRGDSSRAKEMISPHAAAQYHAPQIEAFAEADADMITATGMANLNEVIGVVSAAKKVGMPAVVSLTVESGGRLPAGQNVWDAIAAVDIATDEAAAYYMIDCAESRHFDETLSRGGTLRGRLRGLRTTASTGIDRPSDITLRYPHINIFGEFARANHQRLAKTAKAGREKFKSAA